MEPAVTTYVRQLCKAVAEEVDPQRMKSLLDELLQVLDERLLLASLL
jgi:hypothetical protein